MPLTPSGRQLVNMAGRYYRDPDYEIGRLLDEMEKLRKQAGENTYEPTIQDQDLQQKIQAATLSPALAQISGGFGARGLSGSSLEAVKRATMAGQIGLQSQLQMSQQARQTGMERAQFNLQRNQQLFNALIGSMQGTTMPGAPGTGVKKKTNVGGIIGGAVGAIGGFLAGGPAGATAGYGIGSGIGGGGGVQAPDQIPQGPYA